MISYLKHIMLLLPFIGFSQIDANSLFGLPTATTTQINLITGPINKGALVFDTSLNKVFQYNGTNWRQITDGLRTVTEKTASYTLALTDNYTVLTFNSTNNVILTVPSGLPETFNVSVYQTGTGKVEFEGDGGVTLISLKNRFKTAGQDAGAAIIATATNSFHLTGDLK